MCSWQLTTTNVSYLLNPYPIQLAPNLIFPHLRMHEVPHPIAIGFLIYITLTSSSPQP